MIDPSSCISTNSIRIDHLSHINSSAMDHYPALPTRKRVVTTLKSEIELEQGGQHENQTHLPSHLCHRLQLFRHNGMGTYPRRQAGEHMHGIRLMPPRFDGEATISTILPPMCFRDQIPTKNIFGVETTPIYVKPAAHKRFRLNRAPAIRTTTQSPEKSKDIIN